VLAAATAAGIAGAARVPRGVAFDARSGRAACGSFATGRCFPLRALPALLRRWPAPRGGGVAVRAVGPGAAAAHTGNLTTVCSCRRGRRKGSAAAAVQRCRGPYVTRLDSAVWRGVTSSMRSSAVQGGRSCGRRRPRRS